MLAVIFVECPHTFTIDIFGRFLMWCVTTLRGNDHHKRYLVEAETASEGVVTKVPSPDEDTAQQEQKKEQEQKEQESDSAKTLSREAQQDADIADTAKFTSCVTRMVCKLLLLTESYQPADITSKRNYEVLTNTLRSFVMLGKEEETVLLRLGGG
jgi:hypothetical protein